MRAMRAEGLVGLTGPLLKTGARGYEGRLSAEACSGEPLKVSRSVRSKPGRRLPSAALQGMEALCWSELDTARHLLDHLKGNQKEALKEYL